MYLPNKIAVLLNTNAYSLNVSNWNYIDFKYYLRYKILKETRNGVDGYVFKSTSFEEMANSTFINFPASSHSGNSFTKAIIKKYLKKYFEFINIQFVESPLELEQISADRKIHVQISPGASPVINSNSLTPITYCYFLTGKIFEPIPMSVNGVMNFPFPDGNYAWGTNFPNSDKKDYLGLCFSSFDTPRIPFIHVKENGIQFLGGPQNDGFRVGTFIIGDNFSEIVLANTIAHEIGHAFTLDHWGSSTQEYSPGNSQTWKPVMGGGLDDLRFKLWSKGDNQSEVAKHNQGFQDDFKLFFRYATPFKLRGQQGLEEYSQRIQKPQWQFHEYQDMIFKNFPASSSSRFNNIFKTSDEKLSTKRSRLINTTDITFKDGLSTIEGLIGFPNDFDILKIILKEGTYEISEYSNSPYDERTQLYLGLDIARSRLEVSKSQLNKSEAEIYAKTFNFPRDIDPNNPTPSLRKNYECDNELLSSVYPDGSVEGDSFLKWPASPRFFRPVAPAGSTAILYNNSNLGQFNTFRRVNNGSIQVNKTCMIYLIAYGDRHNEQSSTGFSSYGSVGKYFITIRKNGNNVNLEQLLPEAVPPNCYPTEKLKCVLNGVVEDKIFFTQDPEDYAKNHPYDETSDHPNAKKYHMVINGKLCKISFLLQGKEYGLNDTIDERDKKELFAVASQVPATIGTPRIQEFVMAPSWDYQ